MSFLIVLLFSLAVILLCFAGLGIKVLVKKNGEFKRHCSSMDPYTGKGGGCACATAAKVDCANRKKHPYQPLEVNKELMSELMSVVLLLVALAATPHAQAQPKSIPWSDSFETDNVEWSFIDADGDGFTWSRSEDNPFNGTHCIFNGYRPTAHDDWAVSPAIAFDNASGTFKVEWQVFAHQNYSETYELLYMRGSHFDMGRCTKLYSETVAGGYHHRRVEFMASRGDTLRFAFRHLSENQNFICIDAFGIDTVKSPSPQGVDLCSAESAVIISPNPARDVLHVEGLQAGTVTISDLFGRQWLTVHSSPRIDVSSLPRGVYFLVGTDRSGVTSRRRFVKQ